MQGGRDRDGKAALGCLMPLKNREQTKQKNTFFPSLQAVVWPLLWMLAARYRFAHWRNHGSGTSVAAQAVVQQMRHLIAAWPYPGGLGSCLQSECQPASI